MARDFTKNVSNRLGWASVGTSTIGNLVSGASAISVHAWINIDTTDTGSGQNRIFSSFMSGGSNGIRFNVQNTDGTRKLLCGGRSVGTDTLQTKTSTTDLSLSTWHSVGVVIDIGGDTMTPYVNGAAEGGGAVTFANSTYTQGSTTVNDAIGAQDDAAGTSQPHCFDGRIAEVSIWSGDIGAAGYATLNKGFSALMVRPELLTLYVPLIGKASPESEIISSKSPSISGSLPGADHPRIIYPTGDPPYIKRNGVYTK